MEMYEFKGAETVWISADDRNEAIDIYISVFGEDSWHEGIWLYGSEAVREMSKDEMFSYKNEEGEMDKDTIGNHLAKYCKTSDVFATSMFFD